MGEGRSFLIRVVLSVLAGNTYNINETVYRQASYPTCCVSYELREINRNKICLTSERVRCVFLCQCYIAANS